MRRASPISNARHTLALAYSAMLWRIGLVGFDYPEWTGTFYPRPLLRKDRLRHYAGIFNAVEINATFYSTPTHRTVAAWADTAATARPHAEKPGPHAPFLICPKLLRDVTHGPTPPGSLAGAESPRGHLTTPDTALLLRRWLDSIRGLGPHLGPVLIQFPPRFAAARMSELDEFLSTLPRDLRYAVEFRHASCLVPETAALLNRYAMAWVAMDQTTLGEVETPPPEPPAERLGDLTARQPVLATADFLYVRFLGRIGQFTDRTREHFDPTPRLAWWADRLGAMAAAHPQVSTIYAFFDNNLTGFAPATAGRFARLVGAPCPEAGRVEPAPATQGQLFTG